MGQMQDFPMADQGLGPECDHMLKLICFELKLLTFIMWVV